MKRGGVNKELRSLCREGKITIDTLAAFTVSDDKEQQLKAYRAAKKQRSVFPRSIRELLTDNSLESTDSRLRRQLLQNGGSDPPYNEDQAIDFAFVLFIAPADKAPISTVRRIIKQGQR